MIRKGKLTMHRSPCCLAMLALEHQKAIVSDAPEPEAEGQNGFKLSVFGFDPEADFAALTKEARGRRVFLGAPERSLLLTKVSGGTGHGGGMRIARGSKEYDLLRGWIAADRCDDHPG